MYSIQNCSMNNTAIFLGNNDLGINVYIMLGVCVEIWLGEVFLIKTLQSFSRKCDFY